MIYSFLSGNQPAEITVTKTDWVSSDTINYSDFDRIEQNIGLLRFLLIYYAQYQIPELILKNTRSFESVDYLSDINRIEQNLEVIRNQFLTPPNYLGTKLWNIEMTFDFNDANRLELNIRQLMEYIDKVRSSFLYCGAVVSGEGGLY